MLDSIEKDEADDDYEKIGKNYICNLRELSENTQKAIHYIYKLK